MSHTIATNGYWSIMSRMCRISASRFGAHTSRMRDMYGSRQALGCRASNVVVVTVGPATQPLRRVHPLVLCKHIPLSNYMIGYSKNKHIKKKMPRCPSLKPRHVCVMLTGHIRRQCAEIKIERMVSHPLGSDASGGRVREWMPNRDQVAIPSECQGQHVCRQIVGTDSVGTGFRRHGHRFARWHKQCVQGRHGARIKVLETPCEVRMRSRKRGDSVQGAAGNTSFTLIHVHRGRMFGRCVPLHVQLVGSFHDLRQQGLAESMGTRRGMRGSKETHQCLSHFWTFLGDLGK